MEITNEIKDNISNNEIIYKLREIFESSIRKAI